METTTEGPPASFSDPATTTNLRLDPGTVSATGRTMLVAVALIVALAGIFLWAPWSGGADTAAERTMASRDSATKAATEALIAFNTVDPSRAKETVDGWIGLSGGALESKLKPSRTRAVQTMRRGGSSAAKVLETAVSAVDDAAGLVTVLGVVEIRSTPPRGKTTTAISRFRVLMQRLGTTWRVTYLETVRTTS
jgi:Mce-associated membrane protein